MTRGVIFDMDGVLLDNVAFHLEAFRLFGVEQGRDLTREAVYRVFGRKNEEMLRILLDRELTALEIAAFESRKEEIYRELIRPTLDQHVVPGLLSFLEHLAGRGFKMAVATSGPPVNVDMVLDGLSLRRYFQAVVTSREVTHGKPHPEVFLKAAAAIGEPPGACVVFEDSLSGVTAALRAGCRCIALTTTHTRAQLESLSPALIVSDYLDLQRLGLEKWVHGDDLPDSRGPQAGQPGPLC